MKIFYALSELHDRVFTTLARFADGWLTSALARLTFLAVLFGYFWNSAKTKVGEGIFGIFNIQDGAYFQILGEAGMLAYDFDTANVPWYLDLVVLFGTFAEFVLPVLILVGLFTRIAALGMVVFVAVQSWVDVYVHKVDTETIGALFDRESSSLVMDQRALWLFLLIVLIVKGAGYLSLDHLFVAKKRSAVR